MPGDEGQKIRSIFPIYRKFNILISRKSDISISIYQKFDILVYRNFSIRYPTHNSKTLPTLPREDCAACRLRPLAKPPRLGRQFCGLRNRWKPPRSSASLLRPTACRRRRSSLPGATQWRRPRTIDRSWGASAARENTIVVHLVFARKQQIQMFRNMAGTCQSYRSGIQNTNTRMYHTRSLYITMGNVGLAPRAESRPYR